MENPVQHLDDLPYYEQDSGANILYQFVVKPGSMGLMSSGRVRAKGPTKKAMDTHPGWDQIYIILRGSGTVVVGEAEFKVGPGHIVRIPVHTPHGVILQEGEELEYLYVNAFENQRELDALIRTI
jgi:mannose-6-phosphate isomerase-like protein (cupin superfamily)